VSQKYESPAAFKQALEHRLKAATPVGVPSQKSARPALGGGYLESDRDPG
jgi:hypothetical protein